MPHLLIALAALWFLSCSASTDTEPEEGVTDVAQCTADLTDDQITDAVRIAHDLNQSLHELIACGNMTWKLMEAVYKVVTGFANGSSGELPGGVTFDGEGFYNVVPPGYADPIMKIGFYLKVDSSLGKAGDLLKHDLFNADNYIVGAGSPATSTDSIEVAYTSAGPLSILLGLGDPAPNPLRYDASYVLKPSKIFDGFRNHIEPRLIVNISDTQQETTTLNYDVESPAEAIFALFNGDAMTYSVLDFTGGRSDTEQVMSNTGWDISFDRGSSGTLTGDVDFDVTGGSFDFKGYLRFTETTRGSVNYYCPDDRRP